MFQLWNEYEGRTAIAVIILIDGCLLCTNTLIFFRFYICLFDSDVQYCIQVSIQKQPRLWFEIIGKSPIGDAFDPVLRLFHT